MGNRYRNFRIPRSLISIAALILATPLAGSGRSDTASGATLSEAEAARGARLAEGKGLLVLADTDRNGVLSAADAPGRAAWSWKRGTLIAANVDDDDRDGRPDADDSRIGSDSDLSDLARATLSFDSLRYSSGHDLLLRVPPGQRGFVRVFGFIDGRWRPIDETNVEAFPLPRDGTLPLRIEARTFAGTEAGWNGLADLAFVVRAPGGAWVEGDTLRVRVAPFLMLPNSARASKLFASRGVYENATFLSSFEELTRAQGIPFIVHETTRWQEMWMQDTMEVGYTQIPGGPVMHVTLAGLRGVDSFPPTLLSPGMGVVNVGRPRNLPEGDAWTDWYGNLEVTAPTPAWPLGRVYYGYNTATGEAFHPRVVAFLRAQELQSPVAVDTSWLTIKHVDEILNFVPGRDGRPRMIVVSPRAADPLVPPGEYGPYNQAIQRNVDATVARMREAIGMQPADVVELPVLYEEGHNVWSNPVNGVHLNGTAVLGETGMPSGVRAAIAGAFSRIGLQTRFIDDRGYQDNLGNVHCATNTVRVPPVGAWWNVAR